MFKLLSKSKPKCPFWFYFCFYFKLELNLILNIPSSTSTQISISILIRHQTKTTASCSKVIFLLVGQFTMCNSALSIRIWLERKTKTITCRPFHCISIVVVCFKLDDDDDDYYSTSKAPPRLCKKVLNFPNSFNRILSPPPPPPISIGAHKIEFSHEWSCKRNNLLYLSSVALSALLALQLLFLLLPLPLLVLKLKLIPLFAVDVGGF